MLVDSLKADPTPPNTGQVIVLQEHPLYVKHISRGVIGRLKQKGHKSTTEWAEAFKIQDKGFWKKVSTNVRAYIAHAKLKVKP